MSVVSIVCVVHTGSTPSMHVQITPPTPTPLLHPRPLPLPHRYSPGHCCAVVKQNYNLAGNSSFKSDILVHAHVFRLKHFCSIIISLSRSIEPFLLLSSLPFSSAFYFLFFYRTTGIGVECSRCCVNKTADKNHSTVDASWR